MTPLNDQAARDRISKDLRTTLLVEAAAGTGKTTELVARIVEVLASGAARVHQIVAVTFTDKAAGELKLRLRSDLERARESAAGDLEREKSLEHALLHLEEARVSTIHGFCSDLLRERPVEAMVDPQFKTTTDPEARRLFDHAFDLWMQQALNDPSEGVRRALRRTPAPWDAESGATSRLRRAAWELTEWRDFPTPWRRNPFDRDIRIDALVDRMQTLAARTEKPHSKSDNFFQDTARLRNVTREVRELETIRGKRDYDGLEALLVEMVFDLKKVRKGMGKLYAPGIERKELRAEFDGLLTDLESFARDADADIAALLHGELQAPIRAYEELKQRAGRLDFLDLLLRARGLIRDCGPVRLELQDRYRRIFVDEFQDTDPLQAEILLLLAGDVPGKLFLVGDPKQSIYRFRRADVGIYQQVKERLKARGADVLYLTASFRAVPEIQTAVNAAFAPVMKGDPETSQADYVALSPVRTGQEGQPSVVVLPVPEPYATRKIAAGAIVKSLPEAVGAFVDWMIRESGWKVTEREQPEPVKIEARHVCLLFRRFDSRGNEVTRPYVQALEARGIAHLLVGGKSFHRREEVESLRAAVSAIEWPDDELSVFATLKGSLFAIGDAALLEYRHRHGRFHPFRVPAEAVGETLSPIVEALGLLRRLHSGRNRRPIADTLGELLAATRAHAGFALRPAGEQILANVLHLPELARAYEAAGGLSFRGFVERLREEAGEGQAPEAPILEEGSDGVRLLTVHRAKGLEFPVVILADITAKLAQPRASRHLDSERRCCVMRIDGWTPVELLEQEAQEVARDRAEGVRVAYVAATRARDLLVIPEIGDSGARFEEWWTGPLHHAVYPTNAPGPDTVLNRPAEVVGEVNTIGAGTHPFPGYKVAWIDPTTLDLNVELSFTIRQKELLEAAGDDAVKEGLRNYNEWSSSRAAALENGSRPSVTVARVTEWRAPRPEEIAVIEADRDAIRPAGRRYGALVHEVLAAIPLGAGGEAIARVAALRGRILGATSEEVDSARGVAEAALRHPLLARAAQAWRRGDCRRETPVTLLEEGVMIEGVVDIAFLEAGAWTVIDFKTGRELDASLADYRSQVSLYVQAISRATGQPATGVLMKV